jgi:hypothetical protein
MSNAKEPKCSVVERQANKVCTHENNVIHIISQGDRIKCLLECEQYGLMSYKTVWLGDSPTFRRNLSPPLQVRRISQVKNEEKQSVSS